MLKMIAIKLYNICTGCGDFFYISEYLLPLSLCSSTFDSIHRIKGDSTIMAHNLRVVYSYTHHLKTSFIKETFYVNFEQFVGVHVHL